MKQFIVADDQIDREQQRMKIRKSLETKRGIVCGILAGTLFLPGLEYRRVFGEFTWSRFCIYSICTICLLMVLMSFVNWAFHKVEDRQLKLQSVRE